MTPAHRLLSAAVITSDLLEEVLECRPSIAIGILASMISGGLLDDIGSGYYELNEKGRAALASATNAPVAPQDRAQPVARIETEADVSRSPVGEWDADDEGRGL